MKIYFIIFILLGHVLRGMTQSNTLTMYECWDPHECDNLFYEPPDSNNVWEIGPTTSKDGFNQLLFRENCLMTDTANPYPVSNKSSIVFKINLSNLDRWTDFGFEHYIDSDTLRDGGYIEVSYNTGKTWTNLIFDTLYGQNNPYNLYTSTDSLTDGKFGFSGKFDNTIFQHYWRPVTYNWYWGYAGPPIDSLYLRFTFISDSLDTGKPGWIIRGFYLTGGTEGIRNSHSIRLFSVYPNPATDKLTINFRYIDNDEFTINIISITGSLVYKNNYHHQKKVVIPVDNLNQGIYVVQINHNQQLYYSAFVKK